ncbi:MAG: DEAD/DEAH box helicase family protein [bacterium]|nr:DEAD/DEAH box helicase family protein [bacterium]
MSQKSIDKLIINDAYTEPTRYWAYIRESQEFELRDGRRKAGYWKLSGVGRNGNDDLGEFVELELVNKIRSRVQKWRAENYPNVTGTTRKLLEYWRDREQREYSLFFCQLEAAETAIWLTEASPSEKQGIDLPSEPEGWQRQSFKMATGSGKTVVMSMLIAWQALNKIASPTDTRFTKNIFVVAPGLTVKDRLRVLKPEREDNFYQKFNIVPSSMWQELLQAKIVVENWHTLAPVNENYGPKVVKKGPESDEAFTRRVVPDIGNAQNILIINDEAHHCHRPSQEEDKEEQEKATIWISGIDRIHRARGVLKAFDLTATPFRPTGSNNRGEELFTWIVSDFGLNDAIESGLVKTPRIAVRDDSVNMNKDLRSKLFHIYPEVKDDLNRRAEPHEGLPDLLSNAIDILGGDWLREKDDWKKLRPTIKTPPVMIMICNRTETAARIEYAIKNGHIVTRELGDGLIRIDQDALDKIEAEEGEELVKNKRELAEELREQVNTVGKEGKPGAQVQCVIGVNMLSEGWDAQTVTHILGVRAFTSQLLCEQVIGRGLRRIDYGNLSEPEYVTVFGVPFTYLPVEDTGKPPKPPVPKTKIEPIAERATLEIRWPHVLRVDYKLNYFLELDWNKLKPLELSTEDARTVVEVAPVIDGKPDLTRLTELDLMKFGEEKRFQTLKLQAAVRLRERFKENWEGNPASHVSQLLKIIDEFIASEKLVAKVPQFEHAELLKRIVISLNLQKIVDHLGQFIKSSSSEDPVAIFDTVRPVRSTASAFVWYTSKPTQPVKKSQISHVVADSKWEGSMAFEFERDRIPGLVSWAKNDHLGFEIYYLWKGSLHTYFPDFIIKFTDNHYLILEVKGQKTDQDDAKWAAAQEWVRAVNLNGNFGNWEFKTLEKPGDIFEVVK